MSNARHRLMVLVEGETEEEFVKKILMPKLKLDITATGVGTQNGHRGIVRWSDACTHIRNILSNDSSVYLTTFIDYYGLPNDWPGKKEAIDKPHPYGGLSTFLASCITERLKEEKHKLDEQKLNRFIPFIMVHEFETFAFIDPKTTAEEILRVSESKREKIKNDIQTVQKKFPSLEAINNSRETSPSHRLEKICEPYGATYNKVLYGNAIAAKLGLEKLRKACPQFHTWIETLENIDAASAS